MTSQQAAAFEAGSGVSAAGLLTAIASSVITIGFLWVAWIAFGSFLAWQDGRLPLIDLIWNAVRASVLLLVLGFYLR